MTENFHSVPVLFLFRFRFRLFASSVFLPSCLITVQVSSYGFQKNILFILNWEYNGLYFLLLRKLHKTLAALHVESHAVNGWEAPNATGDSSWWLNGANSN